MQGLWLGLKDAKITERGEFFSEGSFDLSIERLQFKNSDQGKGLLFIAEFKVLTTSNFDDPFDSMRTWILKMTNQAAPGNLKGLLVAAFGKDHNRDLDWMNRVFGPYIDGAIGTLAGSTNPLRGQFVHLETNVGQTSGKTTGGVKHDFTYHNWSRFAFEANQVPIPNLDHLLTTPPPVAPAAPAPVQGPQQGYPYVPPPVTYGAPYVHAPPVNAQRTPDGRYWLNAQTNQWVAV